MFKPICQAAIKFMSSSLILLSSQNFYTLSSFLLSHAYSQVITFRAIRTDFHWHLSPYSPPTLPSMFLNTVPQHVAQIIKHLMSTQRHFRIQMLKLNSDYLILVIEPLLFLNKLCVCVFCKIKSLLQFMAPLTHDQNGNSTFLEGLC